MNKPYTALVTDLPAVPNFHQKKSQNRVALIEAIKSRQASMGYDLESLTEQQLEGLLEYGSPHAFATVEYTDDRNFITGTKGRVHKGCDPLPDDNFRDYHDGQVLKKISGYRRYKRHLMTSYQQTPKEAKEQKIVELLDLVDDKYRSITSYIKEYDLDDLVEISMDRYEQTIRRYLAAMLRIRGTELGFCLTIDEACEAMGLPDTSQFIKYATELQEADLYRQQKILQSLEAIVEQAYNVVYDLHQYNSDLVDEKLVPQIIDDIPMIAGYLRTKLNSLRTNKVIPLVLLTVQRHIDASVIQLMTPLIGLPDYQKQIVIQAKGAHKRILVDYPEITSMSFDEDYEVNKDDEVELQSKEDELNYENQEVRKILSGSHEYDTEQNSYHYLQPLHQSELPPHYYLISLDCNDRLYTYVVSSDTSMQESINQLSDYIENGCYPDLTIYYESDPGILPSKVAPTLFEARMISSMERERKYLHTSEHLTMGMEGELIRSHLAFAQLHDSILLTPYSPQELLNIARKIRTKNYRLDSNIIKVPESLEVVQIDDTKDIGEIYHLITNIQKTTNRSIILHDLREYIPHHLTSMVDLDLEAAIKEYSRHKLKISNQVLLKSELKEELRHFKQQYLVFKEQIQQVSQSERERIHLSMIPSLDNLAKQYIMRLIADSQIRVGASLSLACTRTKNGISYREEWLGSDMDERKKQIGYDHIIFDAGLYAIMPPLLVSPDPNELHITRTYPISDDVQDQIQRLI